MKLFASRVEIDADDIAFLYRQVGFTTVDEGLDLVERMYQGRPVDPKVQYLLAEEAVVAPYGRGGPKSHRGLAS